MSNSIKKYPGKNSECDKNRKISIEISRKNSKFEKKTSNFRRTKSRGNFQMRKKNPEKIHLKNPEILI